MSSSARRSEAPHVLSPSQAPKMPASFARCPDEDVWAYVDLAGSGVFLPGLLKLI
jgi:hypothetical protein